MYILIDADGSLSLKDSDNRREFSIVEEISGSASSGLAVIATAAEDNHYWLDANAIVDLSGRKDDREWVEGFWEMLEKVEPYGYSDLANKRVKAHVVQC